MKNLLWVGVKKMKLTKFIFSISCAFSIISIYATIPPQIIQISVPKCGTHLLKKCIGLLINNPRYFDSLDHFHFTFEHLLVFEDKNIPLVVTHLFYTPDCEKALNDANLIKLFIYRDPRDQVVSLAYYMLSNNVVWPNAPKISFDDLLYDLLTEGTTINNAPPTKNIVTLYHEYLPWLRKPDILSIRFEDLVGSKGGGSDEAQFKTLDRIAKHLGLKVSEEFLQTIPGQLFGGSQTFREGKIGSWKTHFKPEHKELFKKVAGKLLIDLGYEKGSDW